MSFRLLSALICLIAFEGVAMQIVVVPLSEPAFTLTVQSGDRVSAVKDQISARQGTPPQQQQLFFGNRQMQDARTLADYGVQPGSSLQLTARFFKEAVVDAAGGGEAIATGVSLVDTSGQLAVGVSSSSSYTLTHGFWRATAGDPLGSPMTCAPGKHVECGAAWTFDPPTVGFSPGGDVMVRVVNTVTNAGCGRTLSATRTWRAIDGWGDTFHCSQTVQVVDSTAPTVACGPARTVECGTAWVFDTPTGYEICGSVVVVVVSTTADPGCGGTYTTTRTWRAVDACGNSSQCSQTITVGDSTRAPSLACMPGKTLECGIAWSFDAPAASDPCGNVTLSVAGTVTNASCGGTLTVTRTWLAVNACGQSASCSQAVAVRDTTVPTITCAASRTIECGTVWDFDSPCAGDACGSATLSLVNTITNAGYGNTLTAIRTWRATDGCGNTSECSQSVTVRDTTAPALTCQSNKTVECGAGWEFDLPAAGDTCGGVTLTIVGTVTNAGCGGTFAATRTWRANDACGNSAVCTQMVTVRDATSPAIACGPSKTIECGTPWSFDVPTASDACGSTSLSLVSTVTNAGCGQTFSATRTWRVADGCGSSAVCTQTVTVRDTTPPTLVCAAGKTVECGTAWEFDSPSGQETCGSLTVNLQGTVTNAGCGNTLLATRTWLAWDTCGNTAQCSQTVTVRDTVFPAITCAASSTVECGTVWTFDLPTVGDFCGGATLTVVSTATNAACGGTFTATRTWQATDACGLTSRCSQSVTLVDATPPILSCAPDKTVEAGAGWSFDLPIPRDGCDPAPVVAVVSTVTNALPDGRWEITRTWSATDGCGNRNTCSQALIQPAVQGHVRGLVELQSFDGLGTRPDPHTRSFTFVATTNFAGGSVVLKSWVLTLANAGGDTFSFELADVPLDANGLSAKTGWNKRRKLPLAFGPAGDAGVNFTGEARLVAGDTTGDNLVNLSDYTMMVSFWQNTVGLEPDAASADLTGDGFVNIFDYAALAANWFTSGDPP